MSLLLFLAAVAAPADGIQPALFTQRSEWRLCTRQSTLTQLKARLSLDYSDVIQKAFDDCAELLKEVSRTQSAEDTQKIQDEQRRLIRQDVEMFYWDNVTGHI